MSTTLDERAPAGIEHQPVGRVTWVHRDELHANDYNPNHVPTPELKLLKLSILEDGWTQPIVVREDHEIVDGFHRWTISGDPDVFALTYGMVPVVYLRPGVSETHQRMSTVRHNRARGVHHVVKMADIVAGLIAEQGLPDEEVQRRLGMDREEVKRLKARGDMIAHFQDAAFNNGWTPDVPENRE